MEQLKNRKEYRQGVAFAILCAVLWGILPIYWKALEPINPIAILLYRIVLACGFAFVLALMIYKWKGIIEPLKQKGMMRTFFFAGLLISTNWGIYIWAVSNDFIIQTCIGYYIEPLFVCIFGIVLFKESLNKYKLTAIILAGISVLIMLIYFRQIPTIAMTLAISFATYSAIKKKYRLDAVLALLYETMLLVPIATGIIIYLEVTEQGALISAEPYQLGLLALAGIFTGTPLIFFAMATNRISLITLGIVEYISPSLTLILGIFLFREPFSIVQFVSFAIIWVGLVIFTIGEIKENRQQKVLIEVEDKDTNLNTKLEQEQVVEK